MNTFKSLSFAALLGASFIGVPALAADRSAGFVAGAMVSNDGITSPAPAQRHAAAAQPGSTQNAAPQLVQGSYVRDDDGRVLPLQAGTADGRGVPVSASAPAASAAPAEERLFGAFVRRNGIAAVAVQTPGARVVTRDADAETVALRPAR